MRSKELRTLLLLGSSIVGLSTWPTGSALAQLVDNKQAPSTAQAGIQKSLDDEIRHCAGNVNTPNSSAFIIHRDPFRAIRRGRQLFQRKFTVAQGQGPRVLDGQGNLNTTPAIGAGLSDSCAGCHGRPRGGAGFGGDVVTRPDSRDAPHLFGIGLREMLADEITADLRATRDQVISEARSSGERRKKKLTSKTIEFGSIAASPDGSVDASGVQGVDPDLRIRPFFAEGSTISLREFIVGALQNEMGIQAVDPLLHAAHQGGKFVTPSGMVLDGSIDKIEDAHTDENTDPDGDGVVNEMTSCGVDFLEFYLLNYFSPGTYQQTEETKQGLETFKKIGCASCHVPDLPLEADARVANIETQFDPKKGIFNRLFATVTPLFDTKNDHTGLPPLKLPKLGSTKVENIFTDFKRHDVGAAFYERNHDGTTQTQFLTRALWGVGSTPPYGHDGRSINLMEVILRHAGEAQAAEAAFAALEDEDQRKLVAFLDSLVIFPPDDTASTLDPGDPHTPGFPQAGHGSIKLTVLFNNPNDPE
jgi:mono/diheme cytochrome c family protein